MSCFMQPLPLNPSAAFLTLEGAVEDYAAIMSLWQTLGAVDAGSLPGSAL